MRTPIDGNDLHNSAPSASSPFIVMHARRGVTMLELLVVLVLMAIAGALVVPSVRRPLGVLQRGDDGLPLTPIDVVITDARRLAIKRGQPLHLRVASDGVWAVVPEAGGETVQDGRMNGVLAWLPDVSIDALGSCSLMAGVAPPANARVWDALQCRWRSALAQPLSMRPR